MFSGADPLTGTRVGPFPCIEQKMCTHITMPNPDRSDVRTHVLLCYRKANDRLV